MTEYEKMKVITLRNQGVSYGVISQQLGLNLNTVKSFCKRCRENGFTSITDRVYCKNCGVAIKQTPHRKKKQFCCDKCRNVWWNKHLDKVDHKANYEITCAGCGEVFTVYGNKHRKYCCHECYITDRYGTIG